MIHIKRAYEKVEKTDGIRILVDRLWPRGLTKEKAHIDLWLKDIAPTTQLRKWFNHDPQKWPEFKKKYHAELKSKKDLIEQILEKAKHHTVTLIYASKDEHDNNAVELLEYLEKL